MVRVAVVRLQLPPWFRVGVHCGRGGQWRAVVCLYVHLKVGRGGETWDQRNKEQGSCLTNSGPSAGPERRDSRLELSDGEHKRGVAEDVFTQRSKVQQGVDRRKLMRRAFCLVQLLNHINTNY